VPSGTIERFSSGRRPPAAAGRPVTCTNWRRQFARRRNDHAERPAFTPATARIRAAALTERARRWAVQRQCGRRCGAARRKEAMGSSSLEGSARAVTGEAIVRHRRRRFRCGAAPPWGVATAPYIKVSPRDVHGLAANLPWFCSLRQTWALRGSNDHRATTARHAALAIASWTRHVPSRGPHWLQCLSWRCATDWRHALCASPRLFNGRCLTRRITPLTPPPRRGEVDAKTAQGAQVLIFWIDYWDRLEKRIRRRATRPMATVGGPTCMFH